MPSAASPPIPAIRYQGFSSSSSVKLFSGGEAFLAAAGFGGAGFGASATLGGSAGLVTSATLGGSSVLSSAGLGGSTFGASTLAGAGAGAGTGTGTGAVAIFESAFAGALPLRSSRRCMSRICFSRSATRDCDSRSALSFEVTSSWSALTRSWPPPAPLPAPALPASDLDSLRTSFGSADGGAGGVTAADATRPEATLLESVRAGMEATPPASCSR